MGEKVKASTKKRQTAPRSGRTLAAVCKDIEAADVDTFCSLQTMQTGSFHIVLISLPAACIRNVEQQTKFNAVQKHCSILIFVDCQQYTHGYDVMMEKGIL